MYGKHHTPESIEKMRRNRAGKAAGSENYQTKTYDLLTNPLVSPTGEIYTEIYCLHAFCKQHGLHNTHMRNLINGKNRSHKEWRLTNQPEKIKRGKEEAGRTSITLDLG
jgi:hypothetical protein